MIEAKTQKLVRCVPCDCTTMVLKTVGLGWVGLLVDEQMHHLKFTTNQVAFIALYNSTSVVNVMGSTSRVKAETVPKSSLKLDQFDLASLEIFWIRPGLFSLPK
ncbi:hypothetical protein K1719_018237 [Acacia pycnantha]|nr:hypothetical protein K1719_018237 [Acacia pycnantha]